MLPEIYFFDPYCKLNVKVNLVHLFFEQLHISLTFVASNLPIIIVISNSVCGEGHVCEFMILPNPLLLLKFLNAPFLGT